ncbi:hypothetical protein C9J48_13140 [Photobacterium profundum]|nr:hypothetical protein C9J48_13140 [Photobacterium profundum]
MTRQYNGLSAGINRCGVRINDVWAALLQHIAITVACTKVTKGKDSYINGALNIPACKCC